MSCTHSGIRFEYGAQSHFLQVCLCLVLSGCALHSCCSSVTLLMGSTVNRHGEQEVATLWVNYLTTDSTLGPLFLSLAPYTRSLEEMMTDFRCQYSECSAFFGMSISASLFLTGKSTTLAFCTCLGGMISPCSLPFVFT